MKQQHPKLGFYAGQLVRLVPPRVKRGIKEVQAEVLLDSSLEVPLNRSPDAPLTISIHVDDIKRIRWIGYGYTNFGDMAVLPTIKADGFHPRTFPAVDAGVFDRTTLLGSGTRGVYSRYDVPDTTRWKFQKSFLIPDDMILDLWVLTIDKLNRFMTTGNSVTMETARQSLNVMLAYALDEVLDNGGAQIIPETITSDFMSMLYTSWHYMNANPTVDVSVAWPKFPTGTYDLPTPITVLMVGLGYDSILSRTLKAFSIALPNYTPKN